jgi:hypothetical protein
MIRLALAAILLVAADPAHAQSTLVVPQADGTYQIIPPNGPTSYAIPLPGDGYQIITPGQLLTLPRSNGPPAFAPVSH